ncbi:MAG: TraB/GumN family protein [Chlorobi bacterium]|nr:TraB/GumN family protein [Chlorobiota bacterium]
MKKLILIFFALFQTAFIFSQQNDSTANSLLWEISGNGIKQPSYIFGTIHMIPKDDYFFTDVMKEKFDACKKLVLEIDINLSLAEQINAAKQMFLPKGKLLFDYMTRKDSSDFRAYLIDSLKISKSTYKKIIKIKPLFGSSLIIKELLGKIKTYENELNKAAKKKGMEVIGLETLQFQLDLVNDVSIEDQVKMLFEDDMSGNPLDEYYKMVAAYKEQDLTKLKELIDADDSMTKLGDKFLKDRNADWISKIEKLVKNQPVFIAVGAGHLAGDDGVLNLLIQKGYTVKPIE